VAVAAVVLVGAGVAVAVTRPGSAGHHATPTPILDHLESSSPPGTTFCDLRKAQPSVASSITRVEHDGKGQWEVEDIAAANLARLAPAGVHAAATTFARAMARWPDDHAALDDPAVAAAAGQLDAWTAAHCGSS
jgi:hypothetical protein